MADSVAAPRYSAEDFETASVRSAAPSYSQSIHQPVSSYLVSQANADNMAQFPMLHPTILFPTTTARSSRHIALRPLEQPPSWQVPQPRYSRQAVRERLPLGSKPLVCLLCRQSRRKALHLFRASAYRPGLPATLLQHATTAMSLSDASPLGGTPLHLRSPWPRPRLRGSRMTRQRRLSLRRGLWRTRTWWGRWLQRRRVAIDCFGRRETTFYFERIGNGTGS